MTAKTVDEYINIHSGWEPGLTYLRELLLSTGLEETIKWGAPVYMANGKNVVGIGAFKRHFALWFFQGSLLKDNTSLLSSAQENKTKALRQIRFESAKAIQKEILRAYILEAVNNEKEGKRLKPASGEVVEIPPELEAVYSGNEELRIAFWDLSPGKRRDYCNYISEAKKTETRNRRLDKILPLIKEGMGLHDKYRK